MGINLSKIAGTITKDDEDTRILREMNDTLKNINAQSEKNLNLNLAGLLAAPLLKQTQAPGTGTAEGGGGLVGEFGGGDKVYEEVMYEGERMIAETNKSTGKVNDLLTIQEAQQRGILDETGKIKDELTEENSKFDQITQNMEKVDGAVVLNKDQLIEMATLVYSGELLQQDLNDITQKCIDKLKEKFDIGGTDLPPPPIIDITSPAELEDSIEFLNKGVDIINSLGNTGIGQFISITTDFTREFVNSAKESTIKFVDILFGSDTP